MVFFINKQAVEIKTRFESAPLTSINECCCATGIIAKAYGLPCPGKSDDLEQMKSEIHRQIDGKPVPSEYIEKVISLLDGYYKEADITDELYELLKYAYNEQIGATPGYKGPHD